MGARSARSLVLDTGALIAFERGDVRVRRLVERASDAGVALVVPATVVAQVFRDAARQARIMRLLNARLTTIVALDRITAQAVGAICALSKTRDVVDAQVVLAARLHRCPVVTSDAKDLRRIDPHLSLFEI